MSRLDHCDPALLLAGPTTAAIAALGRGSLSRRTEVLAAATEVIKTCDPERRDLLLGAAITLASIVLPRPIIGTALKEAAMPVPVRDTPLGRELYEEGRTEGRQQGRQEGRLAVQRLTALVLRQRFGDDPRIDAVAAKLAAGPDDERLTWLMSAASLDDLEA